MIKLTHVLPALTLLALPAVLSAQEATAAWTPRAGDQNGATVWTSPAIASPTQVTQALKLKSCDANVKVYVRSSAASNSSVTVAIGPNTSVSATALAAATASTTATSTTLTPSGQCVVWGRVTPVAGATESTTFYVLEQSGSFRTSQSPSNR